MSIINKVVETKNTLLISSYMVSLLLLSIFLSSSIEYYTNYKVHKYHNHPDIIQYHLKVSIENYNPMYAGLSSVLVSYPLLLLIPLYIYFKRNKEVNVYYNDIKYKIYPTMAINILIPTIYLFGDFDMYLGHIIIYIVQFVSGLILLKS